MSTDAKAMRELTWLHLCDLHETGHADGDSEQRRLVLQGLLEDLDRRAEFGAPDPDVVIVTGDIAMTGGARSADEYNDASAFLRSLASRLGLFPKLMIVPGNHDVTRARPDDASSVRMLRGARSGEERLDDLLLRAQDVEMLERRLEGYRNFLASLVDIDPEVSAGSVLTGWHRLISGRGISIRFVGLNSAILANDDFDQGRLQLGYAQLRTATANATADAMMVLLTHHSLDWMRDGAEVAPILSEYFDLHLHGHLHHSSVPRAGSRLRHDLVEIGAGATTRPRSVNSFGTEEFSYKICSVEWTDTGGLRLQVWPRKWNAVAGRWRADDSFAAAGADSALMPLSRHQRDLRNLNPEPSATAAWTRWSARTLRNFGMRRTAYPLDLTIRELFERAVNVDTKVVEYSEVPMSSQRLRDVVIGRAEQQGSVLILGEPGAGKSVAAYEICHALAAADVVPVVLRASEFKALLSPGHEYSEVMGEAMKSAPTWPRRLALVIDGLDEMTGAGNSITMAGEFIRAAAEVMAVIVTCRRREFEEEISKWMSNAVLERILLVTAWSVSGEFSDYVRRLMAAGFLPTSDILHTVAASSALTELVSRPLFARMLTYMGTEDSTDVSSATVLYSRYLDRLAASCAATLAHVAAEVDPMLIWETAAQISLENGLIIDEELNYSAVELLVARDTNLVGSVVRRAMAYVLDIKKRGSVWYGQFVHYSFFEFLVAASVYRSITRTLEPDPAEIAKRLKFDLPRRVRHFLTDLLQPTWAAPAGPTLAAVYRYTREADLVLPVRRTVCNMVAYIVSRSFPSESALLDALLAEEDDPFLRDSLLWALCHLGDLKGIATFVRELDRSAARRQMNRGYLLYYHGDLSREAEPPYIDAHPLRSWPYTRAEVLEMISDPKYRSTVTPARRAVDLYTFFDFCITRSEICQGPEAKILRDLVDDLWESAQIPVEVAARLLGQAALCTQPPS